MIHYNITDLPLSFVAMPSDVSHIMAYASGYFKKIASVHYYNDDKDKPYTDISMTIYSIHISDKDSDIYFAICDIPGGLYDFYGAMINTTLSLRKLDVVAKTLTSPWLRYNIASIMYHILKDCPITTVGGYVS